MKGYSKRFSLRSFDRLAECAVRFESGGRDITPRDIESFVLEHKIPQRKVYHDHKSLRIMDTLARLLSVDGTLSRCVAVTLMHGHMFIVANKAVTPYENPFLTACLEQKARLLQEFLTNQLVVLQGSDPRIKLDTYFRILEVVDQLLEHGSSDKDVVPSVASIKKTDLLKERLIEDLIKLSEHYLKGLVEDPDEGHEFRDEILSAAGLPMPTETLPVPAERIERGFLRDQRKAFDNEIHVVVGNKGDHAEQLVIDAYDHFISTSKSITFGEESSRFIRIGISKLACVDCDGVLSAEPYVRYRGTSGIAWPGVRRLDGKSATLPSHGDHTAVNRMFKGLERSREEPTVSSATPGRPSKLSII